jgi:hypothetical protein
LGGGGGGGTQNREMPRVTHVNSLLRKRLFFQFTSSSSDTDTVDLFQQTILVPRVGNGKNSRKKTQYHLERIFFF